MCEIENDYTLGSYAKSHDIYVYREGAGAVPHVGEIERGERENHITREIDVWGRRFVCMGNIHST